MKNLITIILLVTVIGLLHAYKPDGALVKLSNASKEDFLQITGRIGEKELIFSDLKAGKSTPFINMGKTFLTGYFKIITSTDTLEYFPSSEEIISQKEYDKGRFVIELSIKIKENKRLLDLKSYRK
ncbi:MAG TPA: hypothetical protein VFN30_07055 [Chitinophagaceae bacterium]|nr:hypothetical protein [Chitinophagaceae bacterium]